MIVPITCEFQGLIHKSADPSSKRSHCLCERVTLSLSCSSS
ncbi:hypothetical protein GBAR_LOCUS22921 [Geodia barretti]|uniref:Uncharacterized protein n=1 Tax=Geodia barretti TaxID=519541 RepID=A0AA35X7N1_GEOBA|nr:hypothetical protein GBAR_LOCUS22921 [Geodia barretti]